ncbi:endonuclease/exonuclease/phosphatase family protein [Rhodanobacter sp. MP1X3]|uniref:endonuclease/exonuclease/phosphatase family protein n=1 Tax=Rhodanobacter sp. MP1X3 TaxID=2723086 RepID=UPI0016150B24|nr:endonuclease/exonuclease/phosphatase family protein [Rhodanobacter sp. MP1X3]MBB6242494.1 endonuclease/exonuclease/phosphatase family metal-dependent hydrolase [Rhodanobacter sp. MP1X3]
MRFFKLLIAVLLVSFSLPGTRLRAQTLRVMTFNVRTGIANDGPNDWNHRRDIMVRTIREQHPDVLGTQELNKFQGDYLVSKLPQYVWFGIGRRGDDGDEHMGVFYRSDRLRVIDSGNYWLSDTPDKPGSITWGNPYPRMVTWALFERKADGRRFYYCNTHFPYRDQDELARTRSAQEILTRLNALPADLPIVMTGDFNSAPDKPDHAVLTSLLDDAWIGAGSHGGPEKTFHNFTGIPDRRIDWILYRDFRALTAQTVTTQQDGRYPSDHFPVVAVLAWPARPKVRVSEKSASTSLPATP